VESDAKGGTAETCCGVGLIFFFAPRSAAALHRIAGIDMAPVLQGLGTALILVIVEQVRDRDKQTRAAATAEARALQARMNPHFLPDSPV
jgi:LytS/YehU family sensor histidine kinase